MEIILNNYKAINQIIDVELNKVSNKERQDLKQDILYKLCKLAAKEKITYIKALTRLVSKSTVVDYYRFINANTRPKFQTIEIEDVRAPGVGYEVSDIKTDYVTSRDRFSKSDIKILDLILYGDIFPADVAGMVKVHRSTVYRATKKLKDLCR